MTKRPTVREINDWVSRDRYCYVYKNDTWAMRISRARTRKGVLEGRIVSFHDSGWKVIENTDTVLLSEY